MSEKEGFTETIIIKRKCDGCKFHSSEYYYIEDGNSCDSGFERFCSHSSAVNPGQDKKYIGETDNTPDWCPFLKINNESV